METLSGCLFHPFLQLILIQLLPCSYNTDSALLPARNEDLEHPLRPNPINFHKRAGENVLSSLWHQQHWESATSYLWVMLYYAHKCLLPPLVAFSFPHHLCLACVLIPDSWEQSVNSSNNLPVFHSGGPPWVCCCSQASETISSPLTSLSNPTVPGEGGGNRK